MSVSYSKLRNKEGCNAEHDAGKGTGNEDTGHGDQHPGDGHLLAVRLCCRRLATSPRCRASQLDGRDDGGDGGGQEEEDGQRQAKHRAVQDVHQKPVVQVELAGEKAFECKTFFWIVLAPYSVFVGYQGMKADEDSCGDNDDDSRHFGLQDLLGRERMSDTDASLDGDHCRNKRGCVHKPIQNVCAFVGYDFLKRSVQLKGADEKSEEELSGVHGNVNKQHEVGPRQTEQEEIDSLSETLFPKHQPVQHVGTYTKEG